ncbi:hypothetical protein MKW94_006512 [Papaver nudicaule]|uniref:Uncharacterized protein n=1 Tax=Papaver nudicaule TaxID=74823 RepID=A0AA41W1W5_PAPNU|nr:hypothetical protein [Papaver nudicaule]
MCKRSLGNLVYKRRNSNSILAVVGKNNKKVGGSFRLNNCSAQNLLYKQRIVVENNRNCVDSGGTLSNDCSAAILVYRRKNSTRFLAAEGQGNNKSTSGGSLYNNFSAPKFVYKRRNSTSLPAAEGLGNEKNTSVGCPSYNRSAPKLVYRRRKAASLPAEAERENNSIGSGSCLTYNCSTPTLVYKRRKSVSLLTTAGGEDNRQGSGSYLSCNCSAPNLVYKRRKFTNLLAEAGQGNNRNSCAGPLTYGCSAPKFVYQRRNSSSFLTTQGGKDNRFGGGSSPSCNCSVPILVYKRRNSTNSSSSLATQGGKDNRFGMLGCPYGEVEEFDEAQNISVQKSAFKCCNVNGSCSSAKSNLDGSRSMKSDLEDAGECSSSDNLTTNQLGACSTEKELMYTFLRDVLHQQVYSSRKSTSNGVVGSSSAAKCIFQSCKICEGMEDSQKMLICDNCEEAFHISCCSPKVRKIPVDEWYCQACSRKQRRLPRKSLNATNKASKCKRAAPKDHIVSMLSDTKPYTTGVRIGKDFQADVPAWSGPISSDVDFVGKALDPKEYDTLCDLNAKKRPAPSSAGNWLQCQEVLADNTEAEIICGKWRRAPLFEIQTDDWDCSCALPWDPVHADCAVPQELPTDQVLKQLKYVEILKPKLATKQQMLTHTKDDSEDISSVT